MRLILPLYSVSDSERITDVSTMYTDSEVFCEMPLKVQNKNDMQKMACFMLIKCMLVIKSVINTKK